MIRVENTRYEGNRSGHQFPPTTSTHTKDDALRSLIEYELGFGGRVTGATSTMLEIETFVVSKLDVVRFSGPEEEMKPLLEVAVIHMAITRQHEGKIVESTAGYLVEIGINIPITISIAAPMLIGVGLARLTCMVFCAEKPEDLEALKEFDLDTLIDLVTLRADGCPLKECLELVESE